jgi:hypothetical protein
MRIALIFLCGACGATAVRTGADDACGAQPYGGGEMEGPKGGQTAKEYLQTVQAFKSACRQQLNWTLPGPPIYEREQLIWTQTSYIQPQVHPFDRFLYDKTTHSYTVSRYLADVNNRYGGIDAVLLWPTYTNIGIDDKNQFDYIRAMPGGLNATQALVAEFKKHGVRVLWPYNPVSVNRRDKHVAIGMVWLHISCLLCNQTYFLPSLHISFVFFSGILERLLRQTRMRKYWLN